MTNLEIAQKIADKIETSTQEEIDAMMEIVCDIHDIDAGWLFRVVGNLYMASEAYKPFSVNNSQSYAESDPR